MDARVECSTRGREWSGEERAGEWGRREWCGEIMRKWDRGEVKHKKEYTLEYLLAVPKRQVARDFACSALYDPKSVLVTSSLPFRRPFLVPRSHGSRFVFQLITSSKCSYPSCSCAITGFPLKFSEPFDT